MNPGREIKYIDFHTHHTVGSDDTIAIMNLMAGQDVPADFSGNTLFSAGIHPWNVTEDNSSQLLTELVLTVSHPHVVLIGEAGFDRLKGASMQVQYSAFLSQAALAGEMNKPIVIHCVRGWEELRRARKDVKTERPWIIHGFRGDPKLAASLADEDFWFSLGKRGITAEILGVISRERIMLETDDTGEPISEVYNYYADITGSDEETVSGLIRRNFNTLFNFGI